MRVHKRWVYTYIRSRIGRHRWQTLSLSLSLSPTTCALVVEGGMEMTLIVLRNETWLFAWVYFFLPHLPSFFPSLPTHTIKYISFPRHSFPITCIEKKKLKIGCHRWLTVPLTDSMVGWALCVAWWQLTVASTASLVVGNSRPISPKHIIIIIIINIYRTEKKKCLTLKGE